jgi:hypothetical protein
LAAAFFAAGFLAGAAFFTAGFLAGALAGVFLLAALAAFFGVFFEATMRISSFFP